jgi:hypothetical protein
MRCVSVGGRDLSERELAIRLTRLFVLQGYSSERLTGYSRIARIARPLDVV